MYKKIKNNMVLLFIGIFIGQILCFSSCGGNGNQNVSQESTSVVESTADNPPLSEDENTNVATASIVSTGDILLHSTFIGDTTGDGIGDTPSSSYYYDTQTNEFNFDSIFKYFKHYVSKADYAIANMEGSFGGYTPYSGFPCFNVPETIVDSLSDAGVDALTTANNHMADTGYEGFINGQNVIDERKVQRLGSIKNITDKRYNIVDINGIKIGMINYTYATTSGKKVFINGLPISNEFSKKINYFDYNNIPLFYDQITQNIAEMKADGAEATILFIHWGEEYHLTPMDYQKEMAKQLAEIGFDAIIGGHPHVIEPVDVITTSSGKRVPILYSLGNEISNQRHELLYEDIQTAHTEDGILYYTNFSKKADGTVQLDKIDAIPTWVHLYNDQAGKKVYEIVPLDKDVSDWTQFNVSNEDNSLQQAQDSYERTMALVKKGIEKYNR